MIPKWLKDLFKEKRGRKPKVHSPPVEQLDEDNFFLDTRLLMMAQKTESPYLLEGQTEFGDPIVMVVAVGCQAGLLRKVLEAYGVDYVE